MNRLFPDGVCDWARPGVEQHGLLGTWITYTGVGRYRPDHREDDRDREND